MPFTRERGACAVPLPLLTKSGRAIVERRFAPQKLAIVSTHPIQYHAHWFRALAARPEIDLHVFYSYYASPAGQSRAGFGVEFDWDIPLLEGYRYTFLNGAAKKPKGVLALSSSGLSQIIAAGDHDVVLINGWHYRAAWEAIFACWKARLPVMVRGDSQLASPRGYLKQLAKYPVYRFFIPRLDACLAVGTRSRDYYLHYGAAPERIFQVPHTIEDSLFGRAAAEVQRQRNSLRQQWGLQDRQTVFLYAGKFIEKKRPMDFLRAIEAAFGQEPTIAGLMVGDGPLRADCERFVSSRHLPVYFTGFLNQSRIMEAYVAAECLVLPSDETWGLVVNEAMSCSRPVLVSDVVGCAPDLVRNGETGAIFPLGDLEALADVIVKLARNPEHLHAMGESARRWLRPYSLEAAVQGVVDAVKAVTLNTPRKKS